MQAKDVLEQHASSDNHTVRGGVYMELVVREKP